MPEPILELRGLVKRFGALAATDGADLTILPGEMHALIGPNGAGKTTLVQQISGALRPDRGMIRFNGQVVTATPMHRRARAGLVRSYQLTSIFNKFTVLDNVALAVQGRDGSSFRFWRPVVSEHAIFSRAREVLDLVGLSERSGMIAGNLSHAEQRQLEVAVTLGTNPKLMLLDEPMAGMGPHESERMIGLLERLKGRVTVLLVEHDMSAVFRLADRISTLVYGKVIASGTPAEIRQNADVKKAYLGEELV